MRIKTTIKYHFTPVRMTIMKNHSNKDVEEKEPSCTVGENADWYSHYGKQYGDFMKN